MGESLRSILILGGYGSFGRRVAALLAKNKKFCLIIAGRSKQKAQEFCAGLGEGAATPSQIDRDWDHNRLAAEFRALSPWLVIDAAGPFQFSQATDELDPYRVVRAALAAGAHYIDLSDAQDFAGGFSALDDVARSKNLVAICGASTMPALSSAVVAHLARDLDGLHAVDMAISTAARPPIGLSVQQAILSYAGKPIAFCRFGRQSAVTGLGNWRRIAIENPTHGLILHRRVAPCAVPDLDLMPARYPGLQFLSFRAGTELDLVNFSLAALARLVRFRLCRSLSFLARWTGPSMRFLSRFGTGRSGMIVTIEGWQRTQITRRAWHLIARDGNGPWIPCLPTVLLTEKLSKGDLKSGAYSAFGLIDLKEFFPWFQRYHIVMHEADLPVPISPWRHWLGKEADLLPPAINAIHDHAVPRSVSGTVTVRRGQHPMARAVAKLMRFPPSCRNAALIVDFHPKDESEYWHRHIGSQSFSSLLRRWPGHHGALESFGLLKFAFDYACSSSGLQMNLRRWWIGPLPMPMALAPRVAARQWQDGGDYRFSVTIAMRLLGLVVAYRGKITPKEG